MRRASRLLLAFLPLLGFKGTAQAEPPRTCADGVCSVRLTPRQLLDRASALVAEKRYDEATPLIAALAQAPGLAMETRFLSGYVAVETGQLDRAITDFRAALASQPQATRIRLELARAMMLKGNDSGADHHFRLAQQSDDIPPEILATIKSSRSLLRDRRAWHFNGNFGFAPDSNITNGTEAETVNLSDGNQMLPFILGGDSRARSGIGQTAGFSAGYRFRLGGGTSVLADADASGVNYEGGALDDYTAQIAVGPEFRLTEATSISAQATGSQRWFGGKRAATQFGSRIAVQHNLENGQRLGLTLDARRTDSGFSSDYSGWSMGAYATYERVVARSMIASASLFARTEMLNEDAYSGREYGANLGIGGELPFGINAGISGGLSRATYDAPLARFSPDPRGDWRYNGRVYAGLRSLRVVGFSPSITYSYSRNASSLTLYDTSRSRFAFSLARYF